ncbi:MAG: hypothetical protein V4857_15245 [Pseudomonadota bacterium]
MGTTLLLNLVRSRQRINAWVSNSSSDDMPPLVVSLPLDELTKTIFPRRDALLADWQALGGASDVGDVWPAFWRVFWATLSEAQGDAPAAMPHRAAPQASPVATAAHPRAFRGTKFRPPKLALVELDLHAWMADDRLLDGFFARHDFTRWPVLGPDGQPSPADVGQVTPTVATLLARQDLSDDDLHLPLVFRRHFLWLLRTKPADDRIAWLSLWRAFGAPLKGELLAMLARLCALDTAAHKWAELALILPHTRQSLFLSRMLRRRSYKLPATYLNDGQLSAFDAISNDDASFDAFIDVALDNLNRGVNIAYTLIGCRLPSGSCSFKTSTRELTATSQCKEVPVMDIERMLTSVGDAGTHWARRVWQSCAEQPGFARILSETEWESLTNEAADRWLSVFYVSEWSFEVPAVRAAQWRVRLAMFPELQCQLLTLPRERQEKFVCMLYHYVSGWDDPVTLQRSWPVLVPLQARLCRPPFSARAAGEFGLSGMAVNLTAAGWQQLAVMPERSWLAIERACRRDNNATLIRYGLNGVTEALPDFALRSLTYVPKRLMRSMSLIGCLEYNARRRFLHQAASTPWFANKWAGMEAIDACQRILALCVEYGVDSPLPRRLREHLAGTVKLTMAQLARHCGITLARLPSTQLAALDAMVWRHIDGPFKLRTQSTAAHHAVRLHASIDGGNKKTLRRFLLGYAQGGVHTYLDHPLNREWYARHPRINAAVWGTNSVREPVGDGAIKIAIETDPMEILMLGSYVGSCLGLGGLCQYSTVACLVDANKQVAYARDATGRVVARQLLAIDERDRLVCFAVYPYTIDAALRLAFKQFDEALASALALDIYRDDDADGYEVKIIMAMEWWDDGQWHTVEDAPKG